LARTLHGLRSSVGLVVEWFWARVMDGVRVLYGFMVFSFILLGFGGIQILMWYSGMKAPWWWVVSSLVLASG